MTAIKKLHHAAYRCRDSEQTRVFYEDFLGLRLVDALQIEVTKSGRNAQVLHTFFAMEDGACVAFFEEPGEEFEFKNQRDFDLHLALEVTQSTLREMFEKGQQAGIETRGISDHGSIHSIYFRDPNGYVVELTARVQNGDPDNDAPDAARKLLAEWQNNKASTA